MSPRCLRVTCGRRDVATDGHGSMCTVMLGRHTTVHALEDFIPIYYVNTGELGARHRGVYTFVIGTIVIGTIGDTIVIGILISTHHRIIS